MKNNNVALRHGVVEWCRSGRITDCMFIRLDTGERVRTTVQQGRTWNGKNGSGTFGNGHAKRAPKIGASVCVDVQERSGLLYVRKWAIYR